jgi:serine/threonine protein kinase
MCVQGFYGEVYKGTLEQDKDTEPQLVAIKKLKMNAVATSLQDFEREINIMKVSYFLNQFDNFVLFTVL